MVGDSGIAAPSAMARVRDRTRRFVSVVLSDSDAVIIALTCGTMECGALLELSHDRIVSSEATQTADRLKLQCDEFAALFCGTVAPNTRLSNRRDLASVQAAAAALQVQDDLPEAKRLHAAIAVALHTTLSEESQGAAWQSPRVRRLASLALLREDAQDSLVCLHSILGEVVGSDLRRWDDLREDIKDDGVDLMLLSETISSVAAGV